MKNLKKSGSWIVWVAGIVVGAAALLLTALGNPANMGFCIACFLRDTAGAMGLHSAAAVQAVRPEILGLVLGAFIMALLTGEFQPRGGSSPATRFLLGMVVMVGALLFLGCPLRMVIRMGGGDLNAFVGLGGFAAGTVIGVGFLRLGFSLKRTYALSKGEGFVLPGVMAGVLLLVLLVPGLFLFSEKGPGSMRAPLVLALGVSLVVGALAQRARLCMVGGIRDAVLFRDFHLLTGFAAIFVTVLAGNLLLKNFTGFSVAAQPIAHSDWLWNFCGMVLVGWGSVLLGGCPLRQLILAGEGNGDSAVTVLGMVVGAALAHNWGLAAAADSAEKAGGASLNGKLAAGACALILLAISLLNLPKKEKKQ